VEATREIRRGEGGDYDRRIQADDAKEDDMALVHYERISNRVTRESAEEDHGHAESLVATADLASEVEAEKRSGSTSFLTGSVLLDVFAFTRTVCIRRSLGLDLRNSGVDTGSLGAGL
jgi:hypothetical protein